MRKKLIHFQVMREGYYTLGFEKITQVFHILCDLLEFKSPSIYYRQLTSLRVQTHTAK